MGKHGTRKNTLIWGIPAVLAMLTKAHRALLDIVSCQKTNPGLTRVARQIIPLF